MAGRNPIPPSRRLQMRDIPSERRGHHPAILIEDPRLRLLPVESTAGSRGHPAAFIEERLEGHRQEIENLLLDNQRLATSQVALKQELSLAQEDLRQLVSTAREVKLLRDAEVRQVYEHSIKTEAEVRVIGALEGEFAQVKEDVEKLEEIKRELTAKLKAVNEDLERVKSELKEMPSIKTEIEIMQQELRLGRAAVEFEKKMNAANLEQSRAMERNMMSMTREVDKLRAELADAEKRARAVAAAAAAVAASNPGPGYATSYGNHSMGFRESPYSVQNVMHQAQLVTNSSPHDGPATVRDGAFDMQHTHAQG